MSVDELKERWDIFCTRSFPSGFAGVDVNGICVTSIDTFAAGCIDTFVSCGSLDQKRISILESCRNDLNLVMPALEGESHEYFAELSVLIDEALTQVIH